ncbi:MAG: hypothetical protein JSS82_06285 [Bacteroidetes bacterium]|nr:hypothetical protein [Bacteroidota bacterium]
MKAFLRPTLLYILLLSALNGRAQYRLAGWVTMGTGTRYSYSISFSVSGHKIKGRSATLIDYEVNPALIAGTIDRARGTMNFTESKDPSAPGNTLLNFFCYFSLRLHYNTSGPVPVLEGDLIGHPDNGKAICATGKAYFPDSNKILKGVFRKAPPAPTGNEVPAADAPALLPGKPAIITTAATHAQLQLWDDTIEDGDMVSIIYNGKQVLQHYTLKAGKKMLDLALSPGKADTLQLRADNQGSTPPNTAAISIGLGADTHTYLATTRPGQPLYIILKKDK